jgi:hypothetical protein
MTIKPSRFARVLRIGGLNKSGSLWEWEIEDAEAVE